MHDAQTTIGITQNLYQANVSEDEENISDHLNKLKRYWEHINTSANSGVTYVMLCDATGHYKSLQGLQLLQVATGKLKYKVKKK